MTIEYNIIGGLGIIAGILSYMTFNFLNREQQPVEGEFYNWDRLVGMICLLLTIIFLNMIMYSILLIAQNNSLSYLNDTTLRVGLIAIMWSTLGGMGLYVFILVLGSLRHLLAQVRYWFKGSDRKKGDMR